MEKIVIIHTNDLHSHMENWPKIRRYILAQKTLLQSRDETLVTVDLGDFIDRWHPLTEATNGKGNVACMNAIGYAGVTIGNNEGLGNTKEELNHLYDEANFDVLVANLYDSQTNQLPKWAKRYKIIETPQHTKIGLIGVTAPFPLTYEPNGWNCKDPIKEVRKVIEEVKEQCTVLVLLSHLGVTKDIEMAENFPEITVILGAHTHHLFESGRRCNGVQLSAAGKFGEYIGEVQLTVEKNKVVDTRAKALPTKDFSEMKNDKKETADYLEEGHRLLENKKIARLEHTLHTTLHSKHSLMSTTLKAVKYKGQTEVALLNNGLFLRDLPAGIVTMDQLHQVLPHPMRLIRVFLRGKDVIRLVGEIEKNRSYLRNFPITGMGFRGKVFGEIEYDGLSIDSSTNKIYWQGKEIQLNQLYSFTTVDHFLFIPFFPTIGSAGKVEFIFPEFLRIVLGNYLKKNDLLKNNNVKKNE